MSTKASNTDAIARATLKSWDEWVRELHAAGADPLPHPQLAELALKGMPEELSNPHWWAQSVAVAYEQHLGRRSPGQSSDGSFKGTVSATINTDLEGALKRWIIAIEHLALFNNTQLLGEPSISRSERWRYWRANFSDGTKVTVNIGLKGEKISLAVDHSLAPSRESLETWKSFWRQILPSVKS